MIIKLQKIVGILLITSILGYILETLKQKIYLKNNMVIIDKKSVTDSVLQDADFTEFVIGDKSLKSGDEIKIFTDKKKVLQGVVLGITREEMSLILVTHRDEIKKCSLASIRSLKVISRYGFFFK